MIPVNSLNFLGMSWIFLYRPSYKLTCLSSLVDSCADWKWLMSPLVASTKCISCDAKVVATTIIASERRCCCRPILVMTDGKLLEEFPRSEKRDPISPPFPLLASPSSSIIEDWIMQPFRGRRRLSLSPY